MVLFRLKFCLAIAGGCALLAGSAWFADHASSSASASTYRPIVSETLNTQALKPVALRRVSAPPPEQAVFPIPVGGVGPTKPRYAGEPQYPFYCMSVESGLGQPLVDNHEGLGVPVYNSLRNRGQASTIVGYSKDCNVPTRVDYFYHDTDKERLLPLGQATHYQGEKLYRVERGSINRFLYALIMPVSAQDLGNNGQSSRWNNTLIYRFQGGAGIGFRQGKLRIKKSTEYLLDELDAGTAVITSTGNSTHNTYNMLLAEDTARRVKRQFVARYGQPKYTIGFGMSGGGLAQYLMGQNAPGLIDGAIPVASYPDMLSQTLYALDCDLLNTYYGYRSDQSALWQDFGTRQAVEGLYAANGWPHVSALLEPVNQWLSEKSLQLPQGNSSCINGWFGLSSYIHNPQQGFLKTYFSPKLQKARSWNYWEDLVQIFGRNEAGYAQSLWDNVGVQYGLKALQSGQITPETFIHLNWHIGSWKPPEAMSEESLTVIGKKGLIWLSLWSRHNITQSALAPESTQYPPSAQPAKRFHSNPQALEAALTHGQVFTGHADLPIIDLRWYLDRHFDMHHSSPSFAARLRLQAANGHSHNQLIWVSHPSHKPLNAAFSAMHQWLNAAKQHPEQAPWQHKPTGLSDRCFDSQGHVLASGERVWDGNWNQAQAPGLCHNTYPAHPNSRVQAGAPWQGGVFQCQRISVEQALARDLYAPVDMRPHQALLERTFPEGVCDYTAPINTPAPTLRPLPAGALHAQRIRVPFRAIPTHQYAHTPSLTRPVRPERIHKVPVSSSQPPPKPTVDAVSSS